MAAERASKGRFVAFAPGLVNFRRLSQFLFLLLFFVILIRTTLVGEDDTEPLATFFFDIDPLILISTLFASHAVLTGMLLALVTVALTLVLGRFFCGWVCPVGATFNLVSWARKAPVPKLIKSDTLNLLADKARFYRYCIEHQLPLPTTRFVMTRDELDQAADEMTFPLILKPPRHSWDWLKATGGAKVFKVDNADTLLKKAPALLPAAGELILQAWVHGSDANMHSLYVCFDHNNEPLTSCVVAQKIRQWPPDVGVGSLSMEVRADDMVKSGLSILQKIGHVGPGNFQFKKDERDGKFYIIEVNPGRPPLGYPLCESCGVEMTYTCYCAAAGLPLPENRTITRPGSKWISWKRDLDSAYTLWKRGDLTVREWLVSLRGHKWSADIHLDDPMPILTWFGRKITGGCSTDG